MCIVVQPLCYGHRHRSYGLLVRLQALYILVNTAAGNDSQKDLIMGSPLPELLPGYMRMPDKDLRVAALWVVINLTYTYEWHQH